MRTRKASFRLAFPGYLNRNHYGDGNMNIEEIKTEKEFKKIIEGMAQSINEKFSGIPLEQSLEGITSQIFDALEIMVFFMDGIKKEASIPLSLGGKGMVFEETTANDSICQYDSELLPQLWEEVLQPDYEVPTKNSTLIVGHLFSLHAFFQIAAILPISSEAVFRACASAMNLCMVAGMFAAEGKRKTKDLKRIRNSRISQLNIKTENSQLVIDEYYKIPDRSDLQPNVVVNEIYNRTEIPKNSIRRYLTKENSIPIEFKGY
jgi:hypothetical protein